MKPGPVEDGGAYWRELWRKQTKGLPPDAREFAEFFPTTFPVVSADMLAQLRQQARTHGVLSSGFLDQLGAWPNLTGDGPGEPRFRAGLVSATLVIGGVLFEYGQDGFRLAPKWCGTPSGP